MTSWERVLPFDLRSSIRIAVARNLQKLVYVCGDDLRLAIAALALLLVALIGTEARAQACIGFPVQTNQTCSNSITLTNTSTVGGTNVGLQDLGTLTLTNTTSGTISGTGGAGGNGFGI